MWNFSRISHLFQVYVCRVQFGSCSYIRNTINCTQTSLPLSCESSRGFTSNYLRYLHLPMPPKNQRRSHTKSKNGCSQCKVRRIKVGYYERFSISLRHAYMSHSATKHIRNVRIVNVARLSATFPCLPMPANLPAIPPMAGGRVVRLRRSRQRSGHHHSM